MRDFLPVDHLGNQYKECIDCNLTKPPEDFPLHKHSLSYGGYVSLPRCTLCHKEHKRKARLMRVYNLTNNQYDEMLETQECKCALCGSTGSGNDKDKFVVDHCHKTGKVRGLLCWPCNIGLGMFKDNPNLLEKVIQYLNE